MDLVLQTVGVAFAAFVSTNTDNLVLLAVVLGRPGQRRGAVLTGYLMTVTGIVLLGLFTARLADAIPNELLGYLGLIPLAMGLARLRRAFGTTVPAHADSDLPAQSLGAASVAALMLSNGSDTLALLLSLFAETPEPLTYVIAVTVMTASLAWFMLAQWVAGHPWISGRLGQAERWLVPLLLIAMGVYILTDTPTDTLV